MNDDVLTLCLTHFSCTTHSLQVQTSLYSQLATEFSVKPLGKTGVHLREFVGVAQLMFILREYYSLTGDGESVEKCSKVRPYLLLIVKQFVTKVLESLYYCVLWVNYDCYNWLHTEFITYSYNYSVILAWGTNPEFN